MTDEVRTPQSAASVNSGNLASEKSHNRRRKKPDGSSQVSGSQASGNNANDMFNLLRLAAGSNWEEGGFGVLFLVTQDNRARGKKAVLFRFFIQFLQILSFPLAAKAWTNTTSMYDVFDIGSKFQIQNLLIEDGYPFTVGVWVLVSFFTYFALCLFIYVGHNFQTNVFTRFWPITALRFWIWVFVNHLFVSALMLQFVFLNCDVIEGSDSDVQYLVAFPTHECWTTEHLPFAIISVISSVFLVTASTAVSISSFNGNCLVKDLLATATGKIHVFQILGQTVLCVSTFFGHWSLVVAVIQCIVFVFMLATLMRSVPYYSPFVNNLRSGLLGCAATASFITVVVSLHVELIIGTDMTVDKIQDRDTTASNGTIALLAVAPVMGILTALISWLRLRYLLRLGATWFASQRNDNHDGAVSKDIGAPWLYEIAVRFVASPTSTDGDVEAADTILQAGVWHHSDSAEMRLVYSHFLLHVRSNMVRSDSVLDQSRTLKPSLVERLVIFYMDQSKRHRTLSTETGDDSTDVIGFVAYDTMTTSATAHLATLRSIERSFWRTLGNRQPPVEKLVSALRRVSVVREKLGKIIQPLLRTYPKSTRVLRLAADYMDNASLEPMSGGALFDEADRIDEVASKEAQYRQAFNVDLDQLDDFVDNVVSIDRFGNIMRITQRLSRVFGYTPQDIVGQNIYTLVPPPHNFNHDRYLRTYQSGDKPPVVINLTRTLNVQHRNGMTFPCRLFISDFVKTRKRTSEVFVGRIMALTKDEHEPEETRCEPPFFYLDESGHISSFNRMFMWGLGHDVGPEQISRLSYQELMPNTANVGSVFDLADAGIRTLHFAYRNSEGGMCDDEERVEGTGSFALTGSRQFRLVKCVVEFAHSKQKSDEDQPAKSANAPPHVQHEGPRMDAEQSRTPAIANFLNDPAPSTQKRKLVGFNSTAELLQTPQATHNELTDFPLDHEGMMALHDDAISPGIPVDQLTDMPEIPEITSEKVMEMTLHDLARQNQTIDDEGTPASTMMLPTSAKAALASADDGSNGGGDPGPNMNNLMSANGTSSVQEADHGERTACFKRSTTHAALLTMLTQGRVKSYISGSSLLTRALLVIAILFHICAWIVIYNNSVAAGKDSAMIHALDAIMTLAAKAMFYSRPTTDGTTNAAANLAAFQDAIIKAEREMSFVPYFHPDPRWDVLEWHGGSLEMFTTKLTAESLLQEWLLVARVLAVDTTTASLTGRDQNFFYGNGPYVLMDALTGQLGRAIEHNETIHAETVSLVAGFLVIQMTLLVLLVRLGLMRERKYYQRLRMLLVTVLFRIPRASVRRILKVGREEEELVAVDDVADNKWDKKATAVDDDDEDELTDASDENSDGDPPLQLDENDNHGTTVGGLAKFQKSNAPVGGFASPAPMNLSSSGGFGGASIVAKTKTEQKKKSLQERFLSFLASATAMSDKTVVRMQRGHDAVRIDLKPATVSFAIAFIVVLACSMLGMYIVVIYFTEDRYRAQLSVTEVAQVAREAELFAFFTNELLHDRTTSFGTDVKAHWKHTSDNMDAIVQNWVDNGMDYHTPSVDEILNEKPCFRDDPADCEPNDSWSAHQKERHAASGFGLLRMLQRFVGEGVRAIEFKDAHPSTSLAENVHFKFLVEISTEELGNAMKMLDVILVEHIVISVLERGLLIMMLVLSLGAVMIVYTFGTHAMYQLTTTECIQMAFFLSALPDYVNAQGLLREERKAFFRAPPKQTKKSSVHPTNGSMVSHF